METRSRIRPARYAPRSATTAAALFEDAVARLTSEAVELTGDEPRDVAEHEEAADRVVDLLAVRAWQSFQHRSHGDAQEVAKRCVAYVVAADTGRSEALQFAPTARDVRTGRRELHRLTGEALLLLTLPEHFDAATDRVRALLGTAPEGRLAAAWRTADEALRTLGATRHQWVGADPGVVAAAGWVLVDRVGRLLLSAALAAQAAQVAQAVQAARVAQLAQAVQASAGTRPDAEPLVDAARRYTWNHLRGPAPEAVASAHMACSRQLVAALAPLRRGEPR
ncbi:hypothetical protein [Streptomyces qinglanensis]|uniref:hypothetical protein n=1 Tax=Streptomyces qinglanensis TaxID=943816 RepID=UPI003D752F05